MEAIGESMQKSDNPSLTVESIGREWLLALVLARASISYEIIFPLSIWQPTNSHINPPPHPLACLVC